MTDSQSTTVVNPLEILYRLRGATGDLLYVGITRDWPTRLTQHQRDKPWWSEVANVELVKLIGTRAQIEAIEKAVIKSEAPAYNKQHNVPARPLIVTGKYHNQPEQAEEEAPRFKVGDKVRTHGGATVPGVGVIEQRIRSVNHVRFDGLDYLWQLCDNELEAVPSFEEFTGRAYGEHLPLVIGVWIDHVTFGRGVVVDVRSSGDSGPEATIRFNTVGTKHLAVSWAPIRLAPR